MTNGDYNDVTSTKIYLIRVVLSQRFIPMSNKRVGSFFNWVGSNKNQGGKMFCASKDSAQEEKCYDRSGKATKAGKESQAARSVMTQAGERFELGSNTEPKIKT